MGLRTCRLLLDRGHQVTAIDDMRRAQEDAESTLGKWGVVLAKTDIGSYSEMKQSLAGCEAVVHLAALTSVRASFEHPLEYHDVNTTGTFNVLNASAETSVGRVIFSSSAAVYGNAAQVPISESHPTRPSSPYAVSKLAGEAYVMGFHSLCGLEAVILRYFNVYGPTNRPGYNGVVSEFAQRVLTGSPLTIAGDGRQTRDFVYVDDVAWANVLSVEAKRVDLEVLNVGSGRETSVNEVADILTELDGKPGKRTYKTLESGDPARSVADISMARRAIGFEPKFDLRKGLTLVLSHEKSRRKP